MAEMFALLDVERQAEEAVQRQERADMEAEDKEMATLAHDVTMLARATLYANGGYRHKKGDWRQGHGKNKNRNGRSL